MKKITLENLDVDIYEKVLNSGLKVYLCKIPRHTIHARITSLFGGSILEFKLKGDKSYTKVPPGVAHFLEHKLFDKKDHDPLSVFENNGASGNAFTSEFITSYHFTGVSNFYDNLDELLSLVHTPYFTDENILKEKGIIFQEKKEDMDSNYSKVYERSLINTFHNLDYKNTVLGSLEDINSITKDDLYACYNTFYHPSNMILTICGDIDIDKTIKYIEDYYRKKDFGKPKEIIIKEKKEPSSVVKDIDVIESDNACSELFIVYKIKKPESIHDKYLNRIYFSTFIDMKFSGLSEIADIVSNDKNFLSSISPRIAEVGDYYTVSFKVSIKDDLEKAIELIDNNMKDFNFDLKSFELIKKAILNSIVLSFENPYEICSMIVNQIRVYGNIIQNMHKKIVDLDFNTFKNFIKDVDLNNRCIVILKKASLNLNCTP